MGSQRKISFLKRCINDVEEEREKKKKAKLKVLENTWVDLRPNFLISLQPALQGFLVK